MIKRIHYKLCLNSHYAEVKPKLAYVISVLISINEGILFNVNVYIDMKTEFKIVVYFINFLSRGKRVCTHGFACRCTDIPVKFVFINPTFCVGGGVRLFQGRFCVYATVINGTSGSYFSIDIPLTFPLW